MIYLSRKTTSRNCNKLPKSGGYKYAVAAQGLTMLGFYCCYCAVAVMMVPSFVIFPSGAYIANCYRTIFVQISSYLYYSKIEIDLSVWSHRVAVRGRWSRNTPRVVTARVFYILRGFLTSTFILNNSVETAAPFNVVSHPRSNSENTSL